MPRNPDKRHCQTPKCHNWAMRDHSHCRVHRNRELGRGRAGAPIANLNALKTGDNAQPLSQDQLRDLAIRLAHDPYGFDRHLLPAVIDIHQRADHHPLKTILLLRRLLDQLYDPVASAIFNLLLEGYLNKLPEALRPEMQTQIWKQAIPFSPLHRIILLQKISDRFPPEKISAQFSIDPPEKIMIKQSVEKQSTGLPLEATIPFPVQVPFTLSLNPALQIRPPPQR
jgi:hypothetical protein